MISGHSIIGGQSRPGSGATFTGINPATSEPLTPTFHSAAPADMEAAVQLADEAFAIYGHSSGRVRGQLLRSIAANIEATADELVARAHQETALPEARLRGEKARTTGQLRLFAQVAEEGSWTMARIDPAQPQRSPLPRADIRSMLRPLGPVAVFGASNFPLAFSVAGGDTASALAAGSPVVVKAHPAHPGTSELVGHAIAQAVHTCGLPAGVFALLVDAGTELAAALVQHPSIKAVGFTGSLSGGRALMQLAAARPDPIPCYMEMSSANPLFVLPGALQARGAEIAAGLFSSFTLGVGQFCTKPGLVFLPLNAEADALVDALAVRVREASAATMLTAGIYNNYAAGLKRQQAHPAVAVLAQDSGQSCAQAAPALLQVSGAALLENAALAHEVFGPSTLVVRYTDRNELLALARALEGQLTATLHGTETDLAAHVDLLAILEGKAGRLIVNGFPTGVEVCHAMVHGGPYPATSDSRTTSVGTQAIYRFARPVCYQDFPQAALPDELKDENPLGIQRMIDGVLTRDALASAR